MSLMTFQKYTCNDSVYLFFDPNQNEEHLNTQILQRLANYNCGSYAAGIIEAPSAQEKNSRLLLWNMSGEQSNVTEDAYSVYRNYQNPDIEKYSTVRRVGRVYLEKTYSM